MTRRHPFHEAYKKAAEAVAARMDQSKWAATRAVALGGAGLATAIVFLITQIGIQSCSILASLFFASVAIPIWLAVWRVGEAYSFFGPDSHAHFATLRGSGVGILLFIAASALLLGAFIFLIGHFSVLSAVAFFVTTIAMSFFAFKHQANVQAWVEQNRSSDT